MNTLMREYPSSEKNKKGVEEIKKVKEVEIPDNEKLIEENKGVGVLIHIGVDIIHMN